MGFPSFVIIISIGKDTNNIMHSSKDAFNGQANVGNRFIAAFVILNENMMGKYTFPQFPHTQDIVELNSTVNII